MNAVLGGTMSPRPKGVPFKSLGPAMRSVCVLKLEVDAGVFLYWCAHFKRWDRSLNSELTNCLSCLASKP